MGGFGSGRPVSRVTELVHSVPFLPVACLAAAMWGEQITDPEALRWNPSRPRLADALMVGRLTGTFHALTNEGPAGPPIAYDVTPDGPHAASVVLLWTPPLSTEPLTTTLGLTSFPTYGVGRRWSWVCGCGRHGSRLYFRDNTRIGCRDCCDLRYGDRRWERVNGLCDILAEVVGNGRTRSSIDYMSRSEEGLRRIEALLRERLGYKKENQPEGL